MEIFFPCHDNFPTIPWWFSSVSWWFSYSTMVIFLKCATMIYHAMIIFLPIPWQFFYRSLMIFPWWFSYRAWMIFLLCLDDFPTIPRWFCLPYRAMKLFLCWIGSSRESHLCTGSHHKSKISADQGLQQNAWKVRF